MVRSQRDLEMELSKLQNFKNPSFELEQYPTPAKIAAEWAWGMAMRAEVNNRQILDAACGPGIIGIALLLMGAKKVYFLDKDKEALDICVENYNLIKEDYEIGEAEFILEDISLFDQEVDMVVQNPPFGTNNEHLDRKFLEKAFSISRVVYSMHKWTTAKFVEAFSRDSGFEIKAVWRHDFPIKAVFKHHTKPVRKIDVGLWKMVKI